MRTLYICADPGIPFWGTKGASIHVRSFTRALAAAGHDVHVLVARLGRPAGTLDPSITVTEIPAEDEAFFRPAPGASLDKSTLLYEARQFAQNSALANVVNDVVAHQPFDRICERYSLFSYAGRESSRWHNLPFVLEVNAPLVQEARRHRHLVLSPLAEAIERYLFNSADCVVPVSARLGEYITSVAPDASVQVIPNGVELQRFELANEADAWRREWTDAESDSFVVGFVGSLKPWHGIDLLLDAFARVHRDDARTRLVLVGGGPEQETVEQFVKQNELADSVRLTGPVPHEHIPDAMGAMDVLVAPYPAMDSFYFSPLKIYEYMAAGKPIVASAIGQICELLVDGETALLTPPGDVVALADRLRRLRREPSLGTRLGGRARRIAFDQHGWNRRVATWEDCVFHRVADAPRQGVRP